MGEGGLYRLTEGSYTIRRRKGKTKTEEIKWLTKIIVETKLK
tara:strand:- start:6 stop:131 length:126 start_codon:yes stop_codon:yes gene_type:complete